MRPLLPLRSAAVLLLAFVVSGGAAAESPAPPSCRDDAMIVFDASGSMSGTDFNTPPTPRIDKVRQALAKVLPQIAAMRNLGLIDYGPGPSNRCDNIELLLQPAPRSAERIMAALGKLNPAGRTPLTAAVLEAARVLRFPQKPGVVVLLTDGEETCGGDPCAMAKSLRAQGENLTIHVIGYRMRELATTQGYVQSRCMTDSTGGLYVSVETSEQLVEALQKTLGCPAVSSAWGAREQR